MNASSRRGFSGWPRFLRLHLQPCSSFLKRQRPRPRGEVNPGTVDARLEEQTRRLKAAIEVEGLPAGVEVLEASGEVGPSFDELVKTPTVGFRKVQVTEATVDLGGAGGITLTAGAYNVPTLPGPPQVFVETHFDAISIDDLELSGDDESTLESRLGVTDSPGDIVWKRSAFRSLGERWMLPCVTHPAAIETCQKLGIPVELMSWTLWSSGSSASMGCGHRPWSCKRCQHDGHFVKT